MITAEQFAPVLKSRLDAAGLSAAELEAQAGFEAGSIQGLLKGGSDPIINRTIRLIADRLGVDAASMHEEATGR